MSSSSSSSSSPRSSRVISVQSASSPPLNDSVVSSGGDGDESITSSSTNLHHEHHAASRTNDNHNHNVMIEFDGTHGSSSLEGASHYHHSSPHSYTQLQSHTQLPQYPPQSQSQPSHSHSRSNSSSSYHEQQHQHDDTDEHSPNKGGAGAGDPASSSPSSPHKHNDNDYLQLAHEESFNQIEAERARLISLDANEQHQFWLQRFNSFKKPPEEIKSIKDKKQKKFYKHQNALIDSFMSPLGEEVSEEDEAASDRKVQIALRLSLAVNVLLFCMQITAAALAKSLALIATSLDAFMDLLSGCILYFTDRSRRRPNMFLYPQGKSRMEPVGIIIFSALMATVSVELLIQSIEDLINQTSKHIDLGAISIALVAVAIGLKVLLFLYCRVLTYSPTAMTLAADHRNDIVVNSFGLGCAILARYIKWYIDPTGAIVIALIILRSWSMQAYEQIGLLVGKSASTEFLQRLTYIAMSHHPEVLQVDTCRAFHVGTNIFVEIDVVLPASMPLRETHDISESLQIKLEKIPEVERAFVHADYEFRHKPNYEHKMDITVQVCATSM